MRGKGPLENCTRLTSACLFCIKFLNNSLERDIEWSAESKSLLYIKIERKIASMDSMEFSSLHIVI